MVRQDIVVGLRNALERGSSMEQAKQTLINAGYGTQDILEAANFLTGGLGDRPLESPETSPLNQQPQKTSQLSTPKNEVKEPKKKSPIVLIILISILVLLLASLVLSFVFRESLVNFFENLF